MSSPIRIVFLCSSLEWGRDGVGDFTRGLATECVLLGHSCALIALHDRHVGEVIETELSSLATLRLPASMPWAERIARATAFCRAFRPGWISLQFVPYGFHDKGLVWRLGRRLRSVQGGVRLHLMFHELWIGSNEASLKERVIGALQRRLILDLIRQLQPAAVSSSNEAYIRELKRHNIATSHLPLFGSIPLEDPDQDASDGWFAGELRALGVTAEERKNWWLFGVFGAIHPEWWPGELFSALLSKAAEHGRRLVLLTVGRAGPAGVGVMRRLETEFADRVQIRCLGEQSAERVAATFRGIDFGISTSPWAFIGKSSSTAAMREHGLPVIVTRVPIGQGEDPGNDPLLVKFDSTLPARLSELRRGSPGTQRRSIAQRWLAELISRNHALASSH